MEEMKLIEYKPMKVKKQTLKEYMLQKKVFKAKVMARTKIRAKITSLTKELNEGDIRYLSPKVLYKRHYNKPMWSGYYSYLLTLAREAVA